MLRGGSIFTLSRRRKLRLLLEAVIGWVLLVAGWVEPLPRLFCAKYSK
jgi:hypothetical protein